MDKQKRQRRLQKLRAEQQRQRTTVRKANKKAGKSMQNPLRANKMPAAPALKHAKIPVSDPVQAWSDLLADPFGAPSEGVYPPISNSVVPCPSTKVRNYGTTTITVGTYSGNVGNGFAFWFFPSGTIYDQGATPIWGGTIPVADVDAASQFNRTFGPILNGPNITAINGFGACAGFYRPVTAAYIDPVTTLSPTTAGSPLNSLPWDDLENPFVVPGKDTDVAFKCTAFAVRITYSGKLLDTEGYVDFYNPYAWTGTNAEARTMSSLRRDPSHRRGYFSNNRTHTYVWHPNCESSNYARVVRDTTIASTEVVSRMMLQLGGVTPGDTFEIEFIGFQEFTGYTAVATNTPAPIAHDVVHVANAIPDLRGKMNKGATNGPTSTLAQHVAASKAMSVPGIIETATGVHEAVVKHIKSPKQSFMGDLLDVALPFLSFL